MTEVDLTGFLLAHGCPCAEYDRLTARIIRNWSQS
jgi:hypothetical protein